MSTTTRPPIARNLRLLKEHHGLTWNEIARRLEVGDRLVSAWANEEATDPSWPNVVKLAALFEVEPHVFYAADFDPSCTPCHECGAAV